MTNPSRHIELPLLSGGRSPETCRWRCGFQCYQEAPNRSGNHTFAEVLQSALSRRGFLKAAGATMLVLGATGTVGGPEEARAAGAGGEGRFLQFDPISLSDADEVIVPDGYLAEVLIRWGDPILPGAPAFDFEHQSAAAQAGQFGYNCDYVSFMPLPRASRSPVTGLLVVNHEYTNPEIMFPHYLRGAPTLEQVNIELDAHGLSVVELHRRGERWSYRVSRNNVRITARTPLLITGPAAGHEWVGTEALGMLNNCAGGTTPWGTVLTCEENFHQYFANLDGKDGLSDLDPRKTIHQRYGLPSGPSGRRWESYYDRFDLVKSPNEPFKYGWVVEVDPYDPTWTPRKRTSLGRFKHEGATTTLTDDRRVAIYLGDDERFDYVYKFVSSGRYYPGRREANRELLDHGTLYVARFDDDLTGEWIPLIPETVGWSQAEILINTRGAADQVGATRMDRPEDIERNPVTGAVYLVMTNNTRRLPGAEDAANPRAPNRFGHVIELWEGGNDAGATSFRWSIFMLCGDPRDPDTLTYFAGFDPSLVSPIANPDNIVFDREGNLWISTDGQPGTFGAGDGIFAVPVAGPERGFVRQFLSAPVEAEVCGPELTPDNRTLFCAIQHPGEGGTLAEPLSSWPDGTQPPKPSVVTVRKVRGSRIIGT